MMTALAHERLPPAPRFCRTAQLTDRGIVLGEGVLLAPLARRADGAAALAVEGREAEIFALLSLARGGAVRPNILHGLHGVAKSLAQGEIVGATIRLAQIGLPPLRGPRDAEMLKAGAIFLDKGFSPRTLLRAAGIEGAGVSDALDVQAPQTEWDEALHPRDPATGRFITTDAADSIENAGSSDDESATTRTPYNAWSAALDMVGQWLRTPVPEYDQDTGEQVGTLPRWQAIVTNPVVAGAVGAAALFGGEALFAPAAEATGAVGDSISGSASLVSENFGKLGVVVDNPELELSGFTDHGVNQAITRGVSPQDILNTVNNPSIVLQQSGGQYLYLSDDAAVVLSPSGRVITTYPSSMFGPNVIRVLGAVRPR
jgi:hypothetical protein